MLYALSDPGFILARNATRKFGCVAILSKLGQLWGMAVDPDEGFVPNGTQTFTHIF